MRDELREQLLVLGVDADDEQLAACELVCRRRRLDAEQFAELWVAYSLTGGGLAPAQKHLRAFEKSLDVDEDNPPPPLDGPQPPPRIQCADAALTGYLTDPSVLLDHGETSAEQDTSTQFKNDVFSSNTQSTKYSSRTNAKTVVVGFGDPAKLEKCIWNNMSGNKCQVTIVPNESNAILTSKALYGFELLQNKASLLDNNIKYLSQFIFHKCGIRETVSVKTKSQIPVNIFGRIDCDSNGRLNSKSVLLQGTWDDSQGNNVAINLEEAKSYSLFPGQIVAMTGMNTHGNKFTAHDIHSDASHLKPTPIVLRSNIEGSLHVVAACGPFTPSDCLIYDPLFDFIDYIKQNRPHVAIFIGPFLDAHHQSLVDSPPNETYRAIFEKLLERIMTDIESSSSHTQVVLVSSVKDAFHTNVYPTPPYHPRKTYSNLTLTSDPCLLDVGGAIIGVTATDILMHLNKEEISHPAQGSDRLGRLATHLVHQQSFYPLWPPNINLAVDAALWSEHVGMTCTPHFLILPSDFRYFAKNVHDCLVVNPERLTKGIGGGTFMRLQINNGSSNETSLCEILRI